MMLQEIYYSKPGASGSRRAGNMAMDAGGMPQRRRHRGLHAKVVWLLPDHRHDRGHLYPLGGQRPQRQEHDCYHGSRHYGHVHLCAAAPIRHQIRSGATCRCITGDTFCYLGHTHVLNQWQGPCFIYSVQCIIRL